ncbi:hypothetical protein KDN24_07110 [Bacillus sp. Bva_UNVM-123]|uniref:hypothetical protein n=1 Tax=Bacillus sp. Bva_UNVM-123 TaxID=2829798 RepID=UPI00391FA6BA
MSIKITKMSELSDELREIRKEIVGKVLILTTEIEYATGSRKTKLKAKYEAYQEVWDILGGNLEDDLS